MPKIDNIRRIKSEDFDPEYSNLVSGLAEILNFFMEQVTNTINGNLDYDNLKKDRKLLTVIVDSKGRPISSTKFSADIDIRGISVLSARNLTNSVIYPTAAPFINFTSLGSGKYEIKNIIGLPANNKFELLLELTP